MSLFVVIFITVWSIGYLLQRGYRQELMYIKEWQLLADELKFDSNLMKKISTWQMLKGFEPHLTGEIDGYQIEITLDKPLKIFLTTKLIVNIHIKSEEKFFFSLVSANHPAPTYLGRLRSTDDAFFDKKFQLFANDNKPVNLFKDEELKKNLINVFTTNMRGEIELKPLKDRKQDENVLDDHRNNYLLTYSEGEFLMNNERQRQSFQRRLNILIDIAKKIDNL